MEAFKCTSVKFLILSAAILLQFFIGNSALAKDYNITIENSKFTPEKVVVFVGEKVIWTNKEATAQSIAGANDSFKSESLNQGASYSHIFNKEGTFDYTAANNPNMKGQVIVKELGY